MTLSNGTGTSITTLNVQLAEQLIRRMTDGLVNIVDEKGEFLLHLEDGSIIDTKGWGGWEWTHGVALTGLYHHAAVAPTKEASAHSIKTLKNWYNARYEETKGKGAPKNINTMAVMYALACMVEDGSFETEEENKKWMGWLDEWAEWVMHGLNRTPEGGFQHVVYNNINHFQLWDDTLMMTVIPLTKIGLLLHRPEYIEEGTHLAIPSQLDTSAYLFSTHGVAVAKYQFLMHINYLMDTTTGLWFHGWQFDGKGGGHNYAKARWARGNCWVTYAIPLFLSLTQLPPTDPIYRTLVSTLQRQVDAFLKLQDQETGLWHTLLDDSTSYVETSAAAGFAAGIFMALRLGYLTGENYLTVANTALQGVIAQIRPDGEVENVSFGTAMGNDLDFYRNIAITPMPYGQALAMLALVEWERYQRQRNGKPTYIRSFVATIMAKHDEASHSDGSTSSEPLQCVWCRPGSEAQKPDDQRRRERLENKPPTGKAQDDKSDTDQDGSQTDSEYELALSWISCTKCKMWYHSHCVTLQELVEPVGEFAEMYKRFGAPGASGSLPPEVIRELEKQGYDWNWTAAVDYWYCTPCILQYQDMEKEARKHKKKPRSTLKRNFVFPSMTGGDDMTMDDLVNNQQQLLMPDAEPPREGTSRPRRKTTLHRTDYHALNNNISTPTYKWLSLIKDPGKSGRKIQEAHFPRVDGSVLRKSWLDGTYDPERPVEISPEVFFGPDREPIIVPSVRGGFESTGGKVPTKEEFGIDDVVRLVGKDTMVDVIDIATQASSKWTLARWAYYFKTGIPPTTSNKNTSSNGSKRATGNDTGGPTVTKVYNVISLECTGTDLAKLVRPPRLVREIDWVDNCWPDIKKKRKQSQVLAGGQDPRGASVPDKDDPINGTSNAAAGTTLSEGAPVLEAAANDTVAGKRKLDGEGWPKVKLYCLMGKAGSWTDWHVDFAASCVYYTIISGCKVFYFIKPTPANLAAYARWSSDEETQQKEWLGDLVEGPVEKVTLKPGDTMIIPTGYIHAVYTPEDTIVLGGNFLHSYNIETQLRLREIEVETKVPQRMRFPYFDRLCWYVAYHWVRTLQDRKVYRPRLTAGQEEPPRDSIASRILHGLVALAEFLVAEVIALENSSTDAKRRKAIHDRIPKEVVVNASGLARELQWRAKQVLAEEGDSEAVAEDRDQAMQQVKSPVASKKRKRNPPAAASRAVVEEKRPRLKNPVTIEWDKLDESMNDTEQYILRPRPALTAGCAPTSIAQDYIAREETQTITQRRKRVRENEDGDLVEDFVQVVTVTTTRTWTNSGEVRGDWERRLREEVERRQAGSA
ncbi:hypothetical protein QFC22_003508 [Naganishia vaughanmartiniae]|uniref:Uncharacterized protein n=1 Tax=Naganishia vaughanmartiniae TaxID=1424756 RepID=A0ACC2X4S4_9TREE|nr:hypothetical protein QFC22_003508 [Naganishia vaughanmartiniae]